LPQSKSGNSRALAEETKEVIDITTRTLHGVTYPANPFWSFRRKKTEDPNYRDTVN
jgi:hypothetical protein